MFIYYTLPELCTLLELLHLLYLICSSSLPFPYLLYFTWTTSHTTYFELPHLLSFTWYQLLTWGKIDPLFWNNHRPFSNKWDPYQREKTLAGQERTIVEKKYLINMILLIMWYILCVITHEHWGAALVWSRCR